MPSKRVRARPVSTLARWLRVLVLVLAVVGLAPIHELADCVEAAIGVQHELVAEASCGSDCGEDCADDCKKAGCHAGRHHCGCCAPMPRLAPDMAGLMIPKGDRAAWHLEPARATPRVNAAPPREPPRA